MWYEQKGPNQEVCLSTKVFITRNIKGYCFPNKMTNKEQELVIDEVTKVLDSEEIEFNKYRGDALTNDERIDLIMSQVTSSKNILMSPEGKAIFTTNSGDLSVIVNDKEHITIKAMCSGFNNSVYDKADRLAASMERKLEIAFSEKYGFLNSNIKNTGTGIKLLYTVCLPGVEKTKGVMPQLVRRIEQYGWKLYPFVDNKEYSNGGVYIIASLSTLGITEKELFERGEKLMQDVISVEKACRSALAEKDKKLVEDQYYRSYGILRYGRSIEAKEAMALLSWIRIYQDYASDEETTIPYNYLNTLIQQVCWSDYSTRRGKSGRLKPEILAENIRNILKECTKEGDN